MNCTMDVWDSDALAARVQGRLNGMVRDFQLISHERGLILRGRCRTYYVKQLAQHAVMQLSELPILANDIEVSWNSSAQPS